MSFALAQVNVARMRGPLGGPEMAGLAARIEEINRLAEQSPGFVWRLPGSDATADALRPLDGYFVPLEPERLFYNMSVWRSLDDLHHYVYRTRHREMLQGKHQWLAHFERPALALWWLPAGHRPTIAESADRLRALDAQGPTAYAFTFANPFPPPEPGRRLTLVPDRFAVCRLDAGAAVPSSLTHVAFTSITRTGDELSIVCPEALVPAGARVEPGWRGLVVAGPIPFSATGVLAGLSAALAQAAVPIFALSTFDTDHVLVPEAKLREAIAALRAAGYEVVE